jgi:hypothetical protein
VFSSNPQISSVDAALFHLAFIMAYSKAELKINEIGQLQVSDCSEKKLNLTSVYFYGICFV